MIQIGKKQCLNIVSRTDFGVYLGTKEEKVLLPVKQVPADVEIGDALTVFVYRDSQDRLIATTNTPKIELDRIAKLKVAQISQIGAFLDWGLEKDLFLPFKEQTYKVKPGDECLVVLYVDKSSRLCASMRRVYNYLVPADCYEKDSQVSGTVIEINPDYGAYVAIDDKYYLQMDDDSQFVLDEIKKRGGRLPFNDKASPELIRSQFNMSKNEFKRAVGRLFKERKIVINPDSIELTDNN